jgi:hypothetical protein
MSLHCSSGACVRKYTNVQVVRKLLDVCQKLTLRP